MIGPIPVKTDRLLRIKIANAGGVGLGAYPLHPGPVAPVLDRRTTESRRCDLESGSIGDVGRGSDVLPETLPSVTESALATRP